MKENKTKKGGSFFGSFIVILLGIILLAFNEGRTVKMQSSINEALKVYKDVTSEKIDNANEGKLVATTGKINIENSDPVKDNKFGINVAEAKLLRKVEMYQWKEECITDENNNENCNYIKVWSDVLNDSSSFKTSGYSNPQSMKYGSEDFLATNVKVGAFDLPERLLKNLSYNKDLTYEKLSELYKDTIEGFKLEGNYLINSVNSQEPQIGDLRISYKVAEDGEVSLFGVQKGTTLSAFTSKKGKTIFKITRGSYTGKEILVKMTKSNTTLKWVLRIAGILLTVLGVSGIFSPLQRLANKVPILGSIVGTGTGFISWILGLSISLIVIAIAWLRARPLLSLILIIISIVLFIILKLNLGKSIKVSAANAIKKETDKIKDNIKS